MLWFFIEFTFLIRKAEEAGGDRDLLRFTLVLLNGFNFIDGLLHIELLQHLHKVPRFQLGKSQDVFNIIKKDVGRIVLQIVSFHDVLQQV